MYKSSKLIANNFRAGVDNDLDFNSLQIYNVCKTYYTYYNHI